MKAKKVMWKEKIEHWLDDGNFRERKVFSEADILSLAPLILKLMKTGCPPFLLVLPTLAIAEDVNNQLLAWMECFGSRFSGIYLPEAVDGARFMPENEADRAKALYKTLTESPDFVISSISGLLSPAPPVKALADGKITLRKGMNYPFSKLLEKLVELDYDDEYEVNTPGEFSRRGGIIDIFSPSGEYPVRLEFFGDEIESMREFSTETQRSVRETDEFTIIPRAGIVAVDSGSSFFDYIEERQPEIIIVFPEQCKIHLERFGAEKEQGKWDYIAGKYAEKIIRIAETGEMPGAEEKTVCGCYPSSAHIFEAIPEEAGESSSEILRQLVSEQIRQWLETGYTVAALGGNEADLSHIREWREKAGIAEENMLIDNARLPHGIIIPEEKTVFLTEKELFFSAIRRKTAAPSQIPLVSRMPEADMTNFSDLEEGDYAVHLEHGIGIFRGIQEISSRGVEQEVIVIEYADGAKVYVPLWQADTVSRYIGSKKGVTSLSRVGEKKWARSKLAAARSVKEMALEMLKVQALRAASSGYAFPKDDISQKLFEEAFPFNDTRDQVKASIEIKNDMSSNKPMDRLLCGDVGYGKTEIAIRAAFKCVMDGKQVAVLVPTTILAQQHLYSFQERFAEYPVIIEMLSRFRSKREQREILEHLKEGKVDIIIGTHRLIQNDVGFTNLGLVVVDEEQRFGVEHKEKFKRLRATVDVLTMTATPIPRTLYMSMTGVRDLSTIMTAPGLRLPVQTVVSQYDESLVVSAIEKEIQRGGQVYYLHNRVGTITEVCERLRKLIPGATFAAAHGRMNEDELESIMLNFIDGKIDVLVCTTIIESGLDIPNANTMIIERCDRFGLAELYQLRGRIGRWSRQAYAYLMLPKHEVLSGDARKRISAIRRYTHLGAGFKLALRDLEIRGAGNLLGSEQSGHINAIGFDLYCQFLRSTVAQLKGQPEKLAPAVDIYIDFICFGHKAPKGKIAAGFSPDFIPSEKLRMEAYKTLVRLSSEVEIDAFREDLTDRYGKFPTEASTMLTVAKIKLDVASAGYRSINVSEGKVMIEGPRGIFRLDGKIPPMPEAKTPKGKLQKLLQVISLLKK